MSLLGTLKRGHGSKRKPKGATSHFRGDIQGLRAIAVLAVVADHLFHWPSGGFIGVDVFFVISGFLITGLLLREHERTGTISFRGFYERRFKRIMPAAIAVLVVTACASYFLIGVDRFRETVWDSLWGLFFVANWRFAAQGTDYFQEGLPPSPVQHFWSLAVEEQFYLVWPWLMLGLLALGVRRFAWGPAQRRAAVAVAITVITALSFAWAMSESVNNATVAYFSTGSRAWELGVGALIAVIQKRLMIRQVAIRTLLAWVGVAGIIYSLFAVPQSGGFPAPWAALPVLSTALVLLAGIGGDQPYVWPLTNRFSVYIGEISYSLYLWHFPVLVLMVALFPTDQPLYYMACLVMMFALSIASYHWLETPARKGRWFPKRGSLPESSRHGWQITGLAALTIAATTVVGAALVPFKPPIESATFVPSALAVTGEVSAAQKCLGAASKDPALECPAFLGESIAPDPAAMAKDTAGAFDCWIEQGAPMKACSYGTDRPGVKKVALLGDSHAAMLLPGLMTQLAAANWKLDSYVGWGCQWMATGTGSECNDAMESIQERLTTGPQYDLVLVTGARHKTATDKDWVSRQYAAAWAPVAARGTQIVVIADNPGVTDAALQCVSRLGFSVKDNTCATPTAEAFGVTDPLVEAAAMVPDAKLVDMNSIYCDESKCPVVIGNVIAYRDTVGHITGTFSKTLAPYLVSSITAAIS